MLCGKVIEFSVYTYVYVYVYTHTHIEKEVKKCQRKADMIKWRKSVRSSAK